MPVSVKIYFTRGAAMEIRRFNFRPDDPRQKTGIYANLLERIRALYNDDDGDYVVFSSDDELKVALNTITDNTLKIYIKEKEINSDMYRLRRDGPHRDTRDLTPGRSGAKPVEICEMDAEARVLSNHISHLSLSPSEPAYHPPMSSDLICTECQGSDGRNIWYRCTVCPANLCSDCEHRGLHDQHIMMRICSPGTSSSGLGATNNHRVPPAAHRISTANSSRLQDSPRCAVDTTIAHAELNPIDNHSVVTGAYEDVFLLSFCVCWLFALFCLCNGIKNALVWLIQLD